MLRDTPDLMLISVRIIQQKDSAIFAILPKIVALFVICNAIVNSGN